MTSMYDVCVYVFEPSIEFLLWSSEQFVMRNFRSSSFAVRKSVYETLFRPASLYPSNICFPIPIEALSIPDQGPAQPSD